jgi:hypothetical protein
MGMALSPPFPFESLSEILWNAIFVSDWRKDEISKGCSYWVGLYGSNSHSSTSRLGVEVHGVAGISEDEAKNAAEELAIPQWYRSFDEVIADNDIKVVHLCTPIDF